MPEQHFIERPLTFDDAQELVKTLDTISANEGIYQQHNTDSFHLEWSEPGMDLSKSTRGYFTSNGQIAAYLVFWENQDIPVRTWLQWGVHPNFLDYNLSEKIFAWVDNRRDDLIRRCPPDARIVLQSSSLAGYTPDEQALQQAGFNKARISYQMRIDMDAKPPTPNIPDGIIFRNYDPEKDLEAFVNAFRNSFADHFGYVEEPYEKDVEEFRHWFTTDKLFDPTYVFFAIDEKTDDVAGYVMGMKEEHADPTVSHIELLGVCRDYRRRGIATAMLHHAFNIFWENDRKSVTLGVDGSSLTNAVALYERVGMRITRQYERYEKVVRDGQELATVALEA